MTTISSPQATLLTSKFAVVASTVSGDSKSIHNAIQSWRAVSKSVVLFNSPNDLGGAVTNVDYATPQNYPCSLKEIIARLARDTYGMGAGVLVHEDVFIQPDVVKCLEVAGKHSLGNAWAATARAKEYSPVAYAKTGTFTQTGAGTGYVCFITTNSAWRAMEKACPGSLRAGTQDAYDWVANYLSSHIQRNKYHDIEGISPFWQPTKAKKPDMPVSRVVGPQKRYV